MSTDFIFEPEFKRVARAYLGKVDSQVIHDETQLYSAGWDFAKACGGPLTRWVMAALHDNPFINRVINEDVTMRWIVIDTRTHMLMKGFVPAIPGWHCDAVPRSEKFSQPDLTQVSDTVKHYVVTLSDNDKGVSNTQVLRYPFPVTVDPTKVWGSVNASIEAQLGQEEILGLEEPVVSIPDGSIYQFNQTTLHRAAPAHNSGWRFFFRLSTYHAPPKNQIRSQSQVYASPDLGW